ncbi:MAG: helix-turn-helix domain-containing protein [Methylophilaceae bacterium]
MNEIAFLIGTIKRLLKKQGINYRDLARLLKLSEASVKRMFAAERMTLDRLSQISGILGFTLSELTQEAAANSEFIKTLTIEQETLLVSDTKLLLTAVCTLNHWKLAEIIEIYKLTEAECLQKLLILDRLRIIDLLPENRIRLIIDRDFAWLKNGPISEFFRIHGQPDFLNGSFVNDDSKMFIHGMLTDSAFIELQPEIDRLRTKFTELHNQSLSTGLKQKRSASLLLGIRRDWEPAAFLHFRR